MGMVPTQPTSLARMAQANEICLLSAMAGVEISDNSKAHLSCHGGTTNDRLVESKLFDDGRDASDIDIFGVGVLICSQIPSINYA